MKENFIKESYPGMLRTNSRVCINVLLVLLFLSGCVPLRNFFSGNDQSSGGKLIYSIWESESLKNVYDVYIPPADPIEIQPRLFGYVEPPEPVSVRSEKYLIGDVRTFWIAKGSEEQTSQVSAALRATSSNLYVWVQEGISYDRSELDSLTASFEETVFPRVRDLFGKDWLPRYDKDPHIYILYASGIGEGMGGYFSTIDEYPSSFFPSSNECNMLTINADEIPLSGKSIERVIAHELQHMIHFSKDANEDVWVNEGLSEYAIYSAGIKDLRLAQLYMSNPDQQLTHWKDPTGGQKTAHLYGQAFLFTSYFVSLFGEEALFDLVNDRENGVVGYESVMRSRSDEGESALEFNDMFFNWVLANYLQDPSVAEGQYDYDVVRGLTLGYESGLPDCSDTSVSGDVNQYGADYYKFSCPGIYTIKFTGEEQSRLFSQDPYSQSYAYWSNSADRSDTKLTRSFDLTDAVDPYLSYFTWYDLEMNRDFVYVQVSDDGGQTWWFMDVPEGLPADQPNNKYWGLTGASGGWIEKKVDLSKYSGKNILVRFEYITDTSIQGEGFLVDDISLPAIGYLCDFEVDSCGWESDGFVRTQALVPQIYRLAVLDSQGQSRVVEIPLVGKNEVSFTFKVGRLKPAVFVVTAATPFVNIPSNYHFDVDFENK